ncbi:MAG TPA: hypothetical protein VGU20_30495 [Stellaceae bacterium]|nr:hypothetical protein [Stellaceae bacterium]
MQRCTTARPRAHGVAEPRFGAFRRSAQRNRDAIEGVACMLGLLIGVVFGAIVSQEAPAAHLTEQGRAGVTSLP